MKFEGGLYTFIINMVNYKKELFPFVRVLFPLQHHKIPDQNNAIISKG